MFCSEIIILQNFVNVNRKVGKKLNWLKEAEKELKSQRFRLQATENLKERIGVISKLPKTEENTLKQLELYNQLEATFKLTEICEKTLLSLPQLEREILTEFYITPHKDHVDYICTLFAVEKSTVYRLKKQALEQFSNLMFGAC